MKRDKVLTILYEVKPEFQKRFGVTKLALFGSTAKDETTDVSDVDILISFDGVVISSCYFGVQFYLENRLGCKVDLVTDKALRNELRPFVKQEAIGL